MKKKVFMILMAAVLSASAAACGGDKKDENTGDKQTESDNSAADDGSGTDSGSDTDGGAEDSGTAVSKADQIEYNVDDYVKLGDYDGMKIEVDESVKVTDARVQEYAQGMAEYYAQPSYIDTDKKTVEEGDTVNIDYEGKLDGVAFDGGTAKGAHLKIGSGGFIDGFEDGLIGVKVGETVDLNLTFPDPYENNPDLAGKAVVFTVTVNKIVEEDTNADVELTDEFVSTYFNCENVDKYLEQVRSYLKVQSTTKIREAVLGKLLEVCEVNIPDGLLDASLDDFLVRYTRQNCSDGKTLAEYLEENHGMTEEEFHTQITSEMETRLKQDLVMEAIAKKEGIELDEEDYQKFVKQQVESYNYSSESELYLANGVNAESGEKYERKVFVMNTALDQVVDSAKIKYKK